MCWWPEAERDGAIMTNQPSNARTILVVEDDDATRELIRQVLEDMGLGVLLAACGEEGISRARRERPDLILVDLVLPGVDGADVVRAIKADPSTRAAKVIVMSGGGQADRVRAERAGCDAFVAKPFDLELLEATIRSFPMARAT